MNQTEGQRLARAEAVARQWRRTLEALALSDASDDAFCEAHRSWVAAERTVERLRASAGR